jgi:hypothetical protein
LKRSDEHGHSLLLKDNGAKYWRHTYDFAGSEKLLSLASGRTSASKRLAENISPPASCWLRALTQALQGGLPTLSVPLLDMTSRRQQKKGAEQR